MNYRNITKVLSLFGMSIAIIFTLDILISIIYKEEFKTFLFYDIGIFTSSFLIWYILKKDKLNLKVRESILLVNLIWILLGVIGAIPLYLYSNISFSSAFFEAISGFTTTGATIYENVEVLPHTLLFHRSLMHYLGGIGVIVLGIGLLSILNPTGSLSLFKAESTGIALEKLSPKIKDMAFHIWIVYNFLIFFDIFLLKYFGMNWFDAINHAFATISTGGFSTKNSSLAYYENNGIIWTTTIFMILSGVNFLAHLRLYHKDLSGYKSEEMKLYIFLFIFLSLLLTLSHLNFETENLFITLENATFTIASIMTTTGFASVDYSNWSHLSVIIIFLAMFLGGNAGSTSGGVKIIRYLILYKTLIREFKRTVHPSAINSIFIDGNKQNNQIITSTFGFFTLFMFTVSIISIYVYARGYDAMSAISTGFAIVGNIGPGFSLIGPSNNFAFFSDIDKIILSIGMIIGRLECYTVYILLSISFWKKF